METLNDYLKNLSLVDKKEFIKQSFILEVQEEILRLNKELPSSLQKEDPSFRDILIAVASLNLMIKVSLVEI